MMSLQIIELVIHNIYTLLQGMIYKINWPVIWPVTGLLAGWQQPITTIVFTTGKMIQDSGNPLKLNGH